MANQKAGVDKDIKILASFIEIYCEKKHASEKRVPWTPKGVIGSLGELPQPVLCNECVALMDYSADRRRLCPLDPKPTCRNCEIHCYSGDHRRKIREVMRFSGRPFLKHAIARLRLGEIWEVLTHLF